MRRVRAGLPVSRQEIENARARTESGKPASPGDMRLRMIIGIAKRRGVYTNKNPGDIFNTPNPYLRKIVRAVENWGARQLHDTTPYSRTNRED